jgi:putative FmdB family regulatory protein
MPTYDYQCPEGHTFEKFQKMSDKPRAKCPVCGKIAARKISGGAGLVFRGTGFYITDYGKDGKGPRKEAAEKTDKAEKTDQAPASGETSKQPASKADAKSESPAKSSESKSPGKGKASPE